MCAPAIVFDSKTLNQGNLKMLFKSTEESTEGRLADKAKAQDFTEHFAQFFIHLLGVRLARVEQDNRKETCLVMPYTLKGREFLSYSGLEFIRVCGRHANLEKYESILVIKEEDISRQFEEWMRNLKPIQLQFIEWCDELWTGLFEEAQKAFNNSGNPNFVNNPHMIIDKHAQTLVINTIWGLISDDILDLPKFEEVAEFLLDHCRISENFIKSFKNLTQKQEIHLCALEMQSLETVAFSTYPAKQNKENAQNMRIESAIADALKGIDDQIRKQLKREGYGPSQVSEIRIDIQEQPHIHKIKLEANEAEKSMQKSDSGRETLRKGLHDWIRLNARNDIAYKYCEKHDHFLFHVGQTLKTREAITVNGNQNVRIIDALPNRASVEAAVALLKAY